MDLVPTVNLKSGNRILMFLPTSSARTELGCLAMTPQKLAKSVKAIFVKLSYFVYKVLMKNKVSCGRVCR